jgi:nucleoid-associated protein YgaU
MVASMAAQSTAFSAQPSLLSMVGVLGRMTANLGSASNNSTTVTVAGGSLFDMASQSYGDPSSWTAIANANGLSDPELSGIQTLTIPSQPGTAGGVLVG